MKDTISEHKSEQLGSVEEKSEAPPKKKDGYWCGGMFFPGKAPDGIIEEQAKKLADSRKNMMSREEKKNIENQLPYMSKRKIDFKREPRPNASR